MSDRLKFHRQTRPIRFRRLKLFFQSVGRTYEVGTDKCKYLFNYVLYKLNILKRYTYTDDNTVWRPTINGLPICETYTEDFKTKHFVGSIKSEFVDHVSIRQDYFYRECRGKKKRTYTVVDKERHEYMLVSSVVNPGLVIDGVDYQYNGALKVVQMYRPPVVNPFDKDLKSVKRLEPETVEYDLTKLYNIKYSIILGTSLKLDVSYATVQYALAETRENIIKYLNTLTLHDLEV